MGVWCLHIVAVSAILVAAIIPPLCVVVAHRHQLLWLFGTVLSANTVWADRVRIRLIL